MLCACGLQGHETLGIQGTPKDEVVGTPVEETPVPSPGAKLSDTEEAFVAQRLAQDYLYTKVICSGNVVYVYILKANDRLVADPWCYRADSWTVKPGMYLLNLKNNSLTPKKTQSL